VGGGGGGLNVLSVGCGLDEGSIRYDVSRCLDVSSEALRDGG